MTPPAFDAHIPGKIGISARLEFISAHAIARAEIAY
jgi:hypothetical protein